MADKEKKKKKKAKEEAPAAEAAPAEAAPAPAAAAEPAKSSTRSSKKAAKRSGSNIFSMFSEKQIAEFKEGFSVMDHDKDGIINKHDLRATFDELGRVVSDKELDELVNEAPGPLNFTMLLTLFANRMSGGGADEDDVVIAAFKTFDEGDGTIDSEKFRTALMTFGEKFSSPEVDDAFENFEIDDAGKINTSKLIAMLTASAEEGAEEGEAAA